jgi:hypothetical protein
MAFMSTYQSAGIEDNALVRVVFIVQFAENFSPEDFAKIDKCSLEWQNELPRRSTQNAMLINPASNQAFPNPNMIVSLSYEALMKDGNPEFGLRVEQNRIMFLIGQYTRWNNIWPVAEHHLAWAIQQIDSQNPVVNYACEYSDLFRYTGEYDDFRPKGFLKKDSNLVPRFVFDQSLNFHFHSGYFVDCQDPEPHRILTRINCDLRDGPKASIRELSVNLYHQLSGPFVAGSGDIELPKGIKERGLENFRDLHKLDIETLKRLVNDDMAEKIGICE